MTEKVDDPRTQWPKLRRLRREDKFLLAGISIIFILIFIGQNFITHTNDTPNIVFVGLILLFVIGSGLMGYGAILSLKRWQSEKRPK